ncbi:hypothetical protein [Dapis sp. BLCC M229]
MLVMGGYDFSGIVETELVLDADADICLQQTRFLITPELLFHS